MNEHFISIKVDREERPDIDQVYITAVQLMTGHSGWPLNTITLPNGKPIYGGTYHTKSEWAKVLRDTYREYTQNPRKAEEFASRVAKGIQQVNLITPPVQPQMAKKAHLAHSIEEWKQRWDKEWGGDKQRQKFIVPGNLLFLLDYALLSGDQTAMAHVENTLERVSRGGIYDHLGGGFFRYSTDPEWKVPHFEKMLYDNAQMIGLFSRAYTVLKRPEYKEIVYSTIAFLKRQMKSPEGGYYAAMDAGGKAEEGDYYLWTSHELEQALGDSYELFSNYYNTLPEASYGNKYVLHKPVVDVQFSKDHDLSLVQFQEQKALWNATLFHIRLQRPGPRTDDKIITSWNALLVSNLVDAYKAFGDESLLEEAKDLFASILNTNYKGKALRHTYKPGSRQKRGFIADYAFMIDAALNLYTASMNVDYLEQAEQLTATARANYMDDGSGFFMNNADDVLISRTISTNDGDLPSPNSIMARNLLRLGHLNFNKADLEASNSMMATMIPLLLVNPDSYSGWGSLLLSELYPYYEIVVVGEDAETMLRELQHHYLPNTVIAGSTNASDLPLFKNRWIDGATNIYVCREHVCKLPVKSVNAALAQLDSLAGSPKNAPD